MKISNTALRELLTRINSNITDKIRNHKNIGLAGPSGSGKSTLLWKGEGSILQVMPDIYGLPISGTTRKLRQNEVHGRDYFNFPSKTEFDAAEFIEHNDFIGNGNLYGTLRSEVERVMIKERRRACFDVDINGAVTLKSIFKNDFLFTFLDVPIEILYDRLLRRMAETGETEEQIDKRIIGAVKEKRRISTGEIKPDYILKYGDTIRPGEAVNDILLKAKYPFVVN